MQATRQSTRMTIPEPAPQGVSSTLRWRPTPNCRGLRVRTRARPLASARPTRLVTRKGSNSSGKRVAMSICIELRPGFREPIDGVRPQDHLSSDWVHDFDELVQKRDFDSLLA